MLVFSRYRGLTPPMAASALSARDGRAEKTLQTAPARVFFGRDGV
jgi:hypothetical protein